MDVKVNHYLQMFGKIMSMLDELAKLFPKISAATSFWTVNMFGCSCREKNETISDRCNQMSLRGPLKEKQRTSQQEHNLKTVTV